MVHDEHEDDERRDDECPDRSELLLASEDANGANARVRRHLERCPACRRKVARTNWLFAALDQAVADETADGAAERERRFREILRENAPLAAADTRMLQGAPRSPATSGIGRHWWSIAATIALIVTAFVFVPQQTTRAGELLRQAVARELAQLPGPEGGEEWYIRVTPAVAQAGVGGVVPGCEPRQGILRPQDSLDEEWSGVVARLLRDFVAPDGRQGGARQRLAVTYVAWRDRETSLFWRRQDHVEERDGLFLVHTNGDRGPVSAAQASIRRDTHEIVGVTLEGGGCRVLVEPLLRGRFHR